MKKVLALIVMIIVLSGSSSFANGFLHVHKENAVAIQQQGQVQGQYQSMNNTISVSPIVTNVNENTNRNTNKNTNTNNVNVKGNTNDISIVHQRELLSAPQIAPWELPAYQNGKIGDYTANLPNFKGLTKLSAQDIIVKVLAVYNGTWFSRIRLEDLEETLIEKRIEGEKVRYTVRFKDSVTTGGFGGGAGGSIANTDGLSSGSGSILPGYHSSTHNPQFIITFYEIE